MENCKKIAKTREYVTEELRKLGFEVIDSKTNFVFAKSDKIEGEELYRRLKEKGVLIRHFSLPRIKEYNRITIGTEEQMELFLQKTKSVLKEYVQ